MPWIWELSLFYRCLFPLRLQPVLRGAWLQAGRLLPIRPGSPSGLGAWEPGVGCGEGLQSQPALWGAGIQQRRRRNRSILYAPIDCFKLLNIQHDSLVTYIQRNCFYCRVSIRDVSASTKHPALLAAPHCSRGN